MTEFACFGPHLSYTGSNKVHLLITAQSGINIRIPLTIYSEICLNLFVCFVALHPKSTAMVMAGWSVLLTTLSPGQA